MKAFKQYSRTEDWDFSLWIINDKYILILKKLN
jgi:hypothetical protein